MFQTKGTFTNGRLGQKVKRYTRKQLKADRIRREKEKRQHRYE